MQQKHRFEKIKNTLLLILCLNWGVAFLKILIGYLAKSQSIRANGFHSVSDGFSNVLGLVGIWYASKPKDRDHPYGHKKYETLASAGIAGLLFAVSFDIVRHAFIRFFDPVSPEISLVSIIVMVATLFVNMWIVKYELSIGKKFQSDILISDSMHTRADVFLSLSVIIGMIVIRAGYSFIDPIVAVVIAFFIARTAVEILRRSSQVLCDQTALDAHVIKEIVKEIEGVSECHKIRTRGREDDIHIDLHVLLPDQTPLVKSHQISYDIEDAIKKKIPGVTDVIVHIEPLSGKK